MMKRKLISRMLIGAPLGLSISTAITILISLMIGDGQYYPMPPQLIATYGTSINAILVQATGSMIFGSICSAASLIWEKEDWSLLRQTLTHCGIIALSVFPIALTLRWMDSRLLSIVEFFAIFFGIYLIIWLALFFITKHKVTTINALLKDNSL